MNGELENEVQQIERQFWLDKEKLKVITRRFQEELADGLEENGRNIAMNITWVFGYPTGQENGAFLAMDLGGTNIRICWIELAERKTNVIQEQYRLPEDLKTGNAYELWFFIAESLERFMRVKKLKPPKDEPLPLGFTFSWPASQDYIDHGILQTWTKGFDIDGVEGHDVAEQVQSAISKRKLPVRLVALINDTVGALIASAYNDPETCVGAIFGTGCNLAYVEDCASIPKLKEFEATKDLPPDTLMAINCECGAFDNSHIVLPHTKYDKIVDDESPRPGEQTYEKMSAGLYLGEIFRLIVLDLHSRGVMFKEHNNLSYLETPYSIDTGTLSSIENDVSSNLEDTRNMMRKQLNLQASPGDLQAMQRIAIAVAVRGARLCATGCAAICLKKNISKGHVAADGAVATKHPKFKKRWAIGMGEIMDWPAEWTEEDQQPIKMTLAEDGSGIGAAVIAAMTVDRARQGQMVGIRTGSWITQGTKGE